MARLESTSITPPNFSRTMWLLRLLCHRTRSRQCYLDRTKPGRSQGRQSGPGRMSKWIIGTHRNYPNIGSHFQFCATATVVRYLQDVDELRGLNGNFEVAGKQCSLPAGVQKQNHRIVVLGGLAD